MKLYRKAGQKWVRLGELAEAIGQSPEQTWRNFFWVIGHEREPEDVSSLLLPASRAFTVYCASKLGAVRLEQIAGRLVPVDDEGNKIT